MLSLFLCVQLQGDGLSDGLSDNDGSVPSDESVPSDGLSDGLSDNDGSVPSDGLSDNDGSLPSDGISDNAGGMESEGECSGRGRGRVRGGIRGCGRGRGGRGIGSSRGGRGIGSRGGRGRGGRGIGSRGRGRGRGSGTTVIGMSNRHKDVLLGVWKKEESNSLCFRFAGPTIGPAQPVTDDTTILDVFNRYFTPEVWNLLAVETNRYAAQCRNA